jgi:RNA polymerase sigma factor (TIGR02999 family)
VSEITRIINAIESGDANSAKVLLPLVYEELRRLAAHKMANEASGQTLQATALVHEAWLKLTANENVHWQGRAHFFGAAAEAMRRILIDNARRKRTVRHGGGMERLAISDLEIADLAEEDEIIALSEALETFTNEDKEKAQLVKLRYFVGLTIEQAAEVMGISVSTANRWWAYSRAWLYDEIRGK